VINGGEALVSALEAAGVTDVFGLLGSSTIEVYDALYEHPTIRYIGVRDERSGTHMADAFGRISGKPGIILAGQAGPGSANLVTGLIQAHLAHSPVVAITGLVSTGHMGRDSFQEFDQHSVFESIVKRNWNVFKAERIGEFVREAIRYSAIGPSGPVVVNIPRDLFIQTVDNDAQAWDARVHIHGSVPAPPQIAHIKALIQGAQAPVIVAGGSLVACRGSEALLELSTVTGIPVAASAGHGDVVPNDYELFAGQVGGRGNDVANGLLGGADLVLAIGTRLGFNTTSYTYEYLPKSAKIVQFDVDPLAIARYYPVEIGVVADPGHSARVIAHAMRDFDATNAPWVARNEQFKKDRAELSKRRDKAGSAFASKLRPEQVFAELRSVLPRDTIVTLDAGTLCLQATDQMAYFEPPALITPLDFGLVGMSFAAGLGAKVAAPKRTVLSLVGDGGFGIGMTEFTTAVQHAISTVTVVLDNGCWGAEKAYQRDFYNGRYIGADITSAPYDQFARSCGAFGARAQSPGEVADAVRDALKSSMPSVVQVSVDPDALISFRRDSFAHRQKI
jgi:thiamine pyrophosphate-dependent acetolactate synthase large subunit-like protein